MKNKDPEAKERIDLFTRDDIERHPYFDPDGEDKNLFDAIKNDGLIVFYGAGVPMLAGCSGWIELAYNIIDKLPETIYSLQDREVLKEIATIDPKKAITICYHKAKTNKAAKDYFEIIRDSVTPKDKKEFADIHSKIFDLNGIVYITSNIDRGIEANENIDIKGKKIVDLTCIDENYDPKQDIKNGNIFYLHGTVDNIENTIFTVDSYIQFYSSNRTQAFLKEIFKGEYTVLFVGYSLSEYEILQNIFLAINSKEDLVLYKHFLLVPIYSKDLAKFNIEKDYLKIFSVKAIPYFVDYEGYSRLKYVLDVLRKKIREYKPGVLSVFSEIDKV